MRTAQGAVGSVDRGASRAGRSDGEGGERRRSHARSRSRSRRWHGGRGCSRSRSRGRRPAGPARSLVRRAWLAGLRLPARGLESHGVRAQRPAARHHRIGQDLRGLVRRRAAGRGARRADARTGAVARDPFLSFATPPDATPAHAAAARRAVAHADACFGRRLGACHQGRPSTSSRSAGRSASAPATRRRPNGRGKTGAFRPCSSPRPNRSA